MSFCGCWSLGNGCITIAVFWAILGIVLVILGSYSIAIIGLSDIGQIGLSEVLYLGSIARGSICIVASIFLFIGVRYVRHDLSQYSFSDFVLFRSRNSRGIFAWLLLDVIWMLLTVAALVVSILYYQSYQSVTGLTLTVLYAIVMGKSLKMSISYIHTTYKSNYFSTEYLLLGRCKKLLPH